MKREFAVAALIEITKPYSLFHTEEGEAYANVLIRDTIFTHQLQSQEFREYLLLQFCNKYHSPPGEQTLNSVLGMLEARARQESPLDKVWLRVGRYADSIYIDLGTKDQNAVEITSAGWQVTDKPNVNFRRAKNMKPLPIPVPAKPSDIVMLKKYLNIGSDQEFHLLIAFIVSMFRPEGPYPTSVFMGEQGSSKSTTMRVIKELIDPNASPVRGLPTSEDNLIIAARNSWLVTCDNISSLPDWLSDAYCRLNTGTGLSKRTLYTNSGETVYYVMRPALLGGIEEFVCRGDLADRSIVFNLPRIPESNRKTENTFWLDFYSDLPKIFGALLTITAGALRELPNVSTPNLPRMADFMTWAIAVEKCIGYPSGTMIEAYKANQIAAIEAVLDNSPLTPFLKVLAARKNGWEGTASALLQDLNLIRNGGNEAVDYRAWPITAKNLSDRIRRLEPALRSVGINVIRWKTPGSNSERMLSIKKIPPKEPNEFEVTIVPPDSKQIGQICDASDAGVAPYMRPVIEAGPPRSAYPLEGNLWANIKKEGARS